MQVIAVLNQKGGSGKTTIATHLARALQLDGHDVLLVDSDPQGSARDWAAVREDQPVPVVGLDRPTIDRDLKSIARKGDCSRDSDSCVPPARPVQRLSGLVSAFGTRFSDHVQSNTTL